MFIEYEKIQNEEIEDPLNGDEPSLHSPNEDEANNLLDLELISKELMEIERQFNKSIDIENFKDDTNFSTEDLYSNNEDKFANLIFNSITSELNNKHFDLLYRLVNANVNDKIIEFDFEALTKKVRDEFTINGGTECIEAAVNKIPDIYCLILRDREEKTIKINIWIAIYYY